MLKLQVFKSKILVQLLAVLFVGAAFAVNADQVKATQAECIPSQGNSVCFTKDVAAPGASTWSADYTDILEGQKPAFMLYLYNGTYNAVNNITLRDVLPAGLQWDTTLFTITGNGYTGFTYNAADLFGGGIVVPSLASGKTLRVTFRTIVTGTLIPGTNVFTNNSSAAFDTTTLNNDASVHIFKKQSVSINEINWVGSKAATDDQWIELYNYSTTDSLDLTNWTLEGAGSTFTLSGTIAPGQYKLLSKYNTGASTEVTATPDWIKSDMNLAASNLTLTLKDPAGVVQDQATLGVNDVAGGYNSYEYRSAARKDPSKPGTDLNNWFTSENSFNLNNYFDKASPKENNFRDQWIFEGEESVSDSSKITYGTTSYGTRYIISNVSVTGKYVSKTLSLADGYYRIDFISSTNNNTVGGALLNTFAVNSNGVIYTRPMKPNSFQASGEAGFRNNNTFEFKATGGSAEIYVLGEGNAQQLMLDRFIVTRLPDGFPFTYEAEDTLGLTSPNPSLLTYTRNAEGLTIATGNSGYFEYGPYSAKQEPGTWYTATFRVKINYSGTIAPETYIGMLNVGGYHTENIENKNLTISDFPAKDTYYDFNITFKKYDNKQLEFRTLSAGNVDITVDKVTIQQVPAETSFVYEGEGYNIPTSGLMVSDTSASGNMLALQSNSASNWFLRYRVFNEQVANETYKVTFRMKVLDNTTTNKVANIFVSNYPAIGRSHSRDIVGTEFTNPNQYQDFTIYFKNIDPGILEYSAYNYNSAVVTIDKITVEPTTDPIVYYLAPRSTSAIGSLVYDVSNPEKQAFQSISTNAGLLSYAPYQNDLNPNQYYYATFDLKNSDNSTVTDLGYIEVYNSTTSTSLGRRKIIAGDFTSSNVWDTISLRFKAPATNAEKLEYRVYKNAVSNVLSAGKVVLTATTTPPTTWVYEPQDLRMQAGAGKLIASGGQVQAQSVVAEHGMGYLVYGPNTTAQPAGNYKVVFRLAVVNNADANNVVRIDAYNPGGTGVYQSRILKGTDFTASDTYQDFEIPFVRTGDGAMEYRVYFLDESGIKLEKITVIQL